MTKLFSRKLTAALFGVLMLTSAANAKDKIEPIRITPKQDRGIASEDDGFVPLMTPKAQKKPATKKQKGCAGSDCKKKKLSS